MLLDVVGDPMKGWPDGYAPERIRERVDLVFNGVAETWMLRWKTGPMPACFTTEAKAMARCSGVTGGGETGTIEIVRVREGKEIFAQDVSDLLVEGWGLVLPKFEKPPRFSAKGLTDAATVPLIHLADYNQDGQAAEFVLPGPYRAWVDRPGMLIGFSPSNEKLNVFFGQSMAMWEAVRTMKDSLEVITLHCLDHASPTEMVDLFTKGPKGVVRGRKEWACDVVGSKVLRKKLTSSEPDAPLGL